VSRMRLMPHIDDLWRLDLGCGTSVNLPLTPGAYRHYHGVDINVIVGQSGNVVRKATRAPRNILT